MKPKNIVYRLGTLEGLQNINHMIKVQKLEQAKGVEDMTKQQKTSTSSSFAAAKVSKMNPHLGLNPKKSKFIYKAKKNKQARIGEQKKEKQTMLYKYFGRRIFHSHVKFFQFIVSMNSFNKGEEKKPNVPIFDSIKVIDWLMEACHNLHLSRDTFYTAIAITKEVYSSENNQRFSHNIIEIQVASILSLAAKLECNKISYLQAVCAVCGFKKSDIIEGQIFVITALSFKIPIISVYSEMVGLARIWQKYALEKKELLRIKTSFIYFGVDDQPNEWDECGRSNLLNFCSFSDMLMVRLYDLIDYKKKDDVLSVLLQALFLMMNYHNSEYFPVKPSQKTYVILVIENFAKQALNFSQSIFLNWMQSMIQNEVKMKIVDLTYKFYEDIYSGQTKQDVDARSNTRSSECQASGTDLWLQSYRYNLEN